MLLWDYEMQDRRELLRSLTPSDRLNMGVEAIDWTLQTMGPIETDEVREFLEAGMRAAREAVRNGQNRVVLPEDLESRYEAVDEVADEPGTSHLLSALMACSDVEDEVDADALYGVLSYCYEGSLDREGIPVWTVEAERSNARCLAVIDYQQRLIDAATGR